MKHLRKINKLKGTISDVIKEMGGGIPHTFRNVHKLPYIYTKPEFDSAEKQGHIEYFYTMYVNVINVNGFFYPAEMFKYIKLRKDAFTNERTYNIYFKDEYLPDFANGEDGIVLKDVPKSFTDDLRVHYDMKELTDRKKVVVSLPSKLVMIQGLENPFIAFEVKKKKRVKK